MATISGLRMSLVTPMRIEIGPGSCTTLSGGTITVGAPIEGTVASSPQNAALAVWLTDSGKGPGIAFSSDFVNPPKGNQDSRRVGVVFLQANSTLIRFTQAGLAETRNYSFAGATRPRALVKDRLAADWTDVPRPWLVPTVITSISIEAEATPSGGGGLSGKSAVRGSHDPSQLLDISSTGYGVDSFTTGTGSDILEFISTDAWMTIRLLGVTDEL